jgi:hypothetical protein
VHLFVRILLSWCALTCEPCREHRPCQKHLPFLHRDRRALLGLVCLLGRHPEGRLVLHQSLAVMRQHLCRLVWERRPGAGRPVLLEHRFDQVLLERRLVLVHRVGPNGPCPGWH